MSKIGDRDVEVFPQHDGDSIADKKQSNLQSSDLQVRLLCCPRELGDGAIAEFGLNFWSSHKHVPGSTPDGIVLAAKNKRQDYLSGKMPSGLVPGFD